MRFLLLHTARDWSGTARALAVAARGLTQRDHSVIFATTPDSNVERVASRDAATREGEPAYEVEAFTSEGGVLGAAWRLRALIGEHFSDIVVVHTDREHLIAALGCLMARRGRVVRRVPAGTTLRIGRRARTVSRFVPMVLLFANEADARAVPLPRYARASVIAPLGVEAAAYDSIARDEAERTYIACVYDQMSRGRGAAAIRTIAMLAPRHPELHLVIVGTGSDDDDLRMQAAALGILHLVNFLGEREDAIHVMRNARLGWVMADSDTAAFGILDLMALGVPVLAADDPLAQRYILPQITGALLSPDDSALTAAAVAGLLASESTRAAMGSAARVRVAREFPEEATTDGFERAARAVTSAR